MRAAKALRVFHLKERIREISKQLKDNSENEGEIDKIKEEIATITSQISAS